MYDCRQAWPGPREIRTLARSAKLTTTTSATHRTHWRRSALRGCPCLVLACLGLSPCFGRSKSKTNFRDLNFFFFPPPPLQPNTTPKSTFKPWHGGISGPQPCLECLHLKNFAGPEKFFPSNSFLNLIPCQNELSSPGMVEYLTLRSVLDGCTWKTVRGLKSFFPPTPLLARLEALFIPNAKLKKILRNFPTFTIWTP